MSRHVSVAGFEPSEGSSSILGNIASSVSGIATSIGNAVVDEGRQLLNGVVSTVRKVFPSALPTATAALAQLSYRGTTGNFQSAMEPIVLSAKFQHISAMNPETQGSPCYQRDLINTFSGFIMCENPVFSGSIGTDVERTAVEAFMAGGFYYE